MAQIPIEELARMSEREAVRRHFDERNVRWIAAPLFLSAVITVILTIAMLATQKVTEMRVLLIVSNMALVFATAAAVQPRKRAKGEATRRVNIRAWTLGYLAAQYTIILVTNAHYEGLPGFAITYICLLLPFRFTPAEHLGLHAYFVAGTWISAMLLGLPKRVSMHALMGGVGAVNVFVLAVALIMSLARKRSFLGTFREDQIRAREEVRMRGELQLARELQLSMLPLEAPRLPWIDLAGVSLPATEVGGDYFDYFVLGDDAVAIVSSDVAGHGMASGLVLAAVRAGVTLLRDSLRDTAAVLQRLDQLIVQTSRRRTLVSTAIVLIDRAAGRATITSAGHPPVLVRRADGIEMIELSSPPLGVRLPHAPAYRHLDFAPGDVFVIYSDGAYETRNPAGESYGFDRLQQIVSDGTGTATAAEIRDAIVRDLTAFRGGAEQADDVTVVVARV